MLFAFDIDGTLRTTDNHVVLDSTIKALNKLRENDHQVIIATGRGLDSLTNTKISNLFKFDGYVCNNGQTLLDSNFNIIFQEYMNSKIVNKAIEVGNKLNIPVALKTNPRILTMEANENVIRSANFFNNPIPKVGKYTNQKVEALIAYGDLDYDYKEFKDIDGLDVMPGESSYADMTISGLSKATGINYFVKKYNLDGYVCFGDSLNDYEMFKHASFSICMGQGNEKLKAISNYVSSNCNDDGIYNACVNLKYIKED
ncbi:MAG: Cof-type HAD-IIB family hydrolase [Thomasclavelia sp.]|nr:Cof-type HAD-IIB family hydrolase [Thomasclavelia sp.]